MTTITINETNSTNTTKVSDLVIAAQAGDRDAFGQLFQRFERLVMGIALRRLGDYADAQELCQDVFLQALLKINQLQQPECFGGWLRSITHRMAINRVVRSRPVFTTEPELFETYCVEQDTPLSEALETERNGQVHEGLSRLRSLDRETLEAFYVRGCSLREMSDQFSAPVGTIKRRLHVARKRLAKEVVELVAL